jgi:hypothetical protein
MKKYMKISTANFKLMILSVSISVLFSSCLATIATITAIKTKQSGKKLQLSDTLPEIDKKRKAKILTAFYELDNTLTPNDQIKNKKAKEKDEMSLVFSHELEPETLEGTDFAITTKNGTVHMVEAASLLPANEEFELRTVVLIGEYGNHPDNPPVSVEVVGDLMARTGQNFKGKSVEVIPLSKGPILSYAEYFIINEDYPYVKKGAGCDCPREKTSSVVKAVWTGGVRAVNGKELGDNEREAFEVVVVQGSDTITLTPFQLADLADNDNNIDLCLSESGIPVKVIVKENIAIDPRDDPNPRTEIEVVSRW